jgi:alkanesulfonate monooxygenase SsuD/methylene tetrahydromethanopterin reductase-like flavin-dependent oxidoreductase (luciferase family)
MKLGTSLRFVFPTSDATLPMYQAMVASLPPGAFVERPMGPVTIEEQVRHLLEVSQAAADAGLWAVIVGDNHNVPAIYANCFQPVPTIARLTAVTATLDVGAVFLAPFYDPLLLAEQIATIAALANGPTLWVFAVGDRQAAFDGFGIPRRERARRTELLVPAVRSLLAGETVTAEGPGWRIDGASISPVPRRPPRILLAGAADAAIDRAARLGDGWVTAQNATDDELARQLTRYQTGCARHGRQPLPVLRRDIFVAPTDEQALAHVEPILAEGYRGVGLERLLVGSPKTVVDRLAGYHQLGFDHVLVRHVSGDHAAILDSFELIGRHVIPEISEWREVDQVPGSGVG